MIDLVIVDSSSTVRQLIRAIAETDPGIRIVGEADEGRRALELAMSLHPDIMTMDVHLAGLSGVETIRSIMVEAPCPIIAVTDEVATGGDDQRAWEAAGALLTLPKPGGLPEEDPRARDLLHNLRVMSGIPMVRRRKPRAGAPLPTGRDKGRRPVEILGIGASTGGPPAIQSVLSGLPRDIGVPIVVVQHIAEGFVRGMVRWLDTSTHHTVKLGEDGGPLLPGNVYIAPDGTHLRVTKRRRLVVDDSPPIGGHRPSVNMLFDSLAEAFGARAGALLLTGMGKDGAAGLRAIRAAGGRTLAQDEASCIVFGMPGEAVLLDAAEVVKPLKEIPAVVTRWRNP